MMLYYVMLCWVRLGGMHSIEELNEISLCNLNSDVCNGLWHSVVVSERRHNDEGRSILHV